MRIYAFSGFCLLLTIIHVRFTVEAAPAVQADSASIDVNGSPADIASNSHYQRRDTDAGDYRCSINDNSPSTSAVLTLALGLRGEFGDGQDYSVQTKLISGACTYVTESEFEGPEAAKIEICGAHGITALKVDIGNAILKLITLKGCSKHTNGINRTEGWIGYHNWGKYKVGPM